MSADKVRHHLDSVFVADRADVVQEEHISELQVRGQLIQLAGVNIPEIPIIQDIYMLEVFHQEGGEAVSEGLFDYQDRAAVRLLGVFNVADRVVAADKSVVLGAGVPLADVCYDLPVPGFVFALQLNLFLC